MKNKKILAFTPIFYPHMGGAERTVYELYVRFVNKYNCEVDLVTLNTENAKKIEILDGINIFRIGKDFKNKYIKFLLLQILFLWFYFKNRKSNYDILHVHYAFPLSIAIVIIKLFSNTKVVISEYHFGTGADVISYEQNPSYANKVSGYIYKLANKILTISKDNKEFIKQFSNRGDTIVIKQGTDHHFFKPSNCTDIDKKDYLGIRQYMFITTSRISQRKNIEDMIETIFLLKEKGLDTILYICGKPEAGQEEYLYKLNNLVEKYNLSNNIFFKGFVSDDELKKMYACADLFLLTSKYEGFGIANTEALSSGTPVVTYDTKAATDFIKNNYNGYVINSNNPKEFSDIISELLNKVNLLKDMSINARKSVEEELNWDLYSEINFNIINQEMEK
jgi:glycosyltransferase involved in cell wall biosynthesis